MIVKTIKPNDVDIDIAIDEIEKDMVILSKLNHPNIIKLYGAGYNLEGYRFLVLEHLGGDTMENKIHANKGKKRNTLHMKSNNKMWTRDALHDAKAIASAMEYCHSGIDEYIIMHRDMKPDNAGKFFLSSLQNR